MKPIKNPRQLSCTQIQLNILIENLKKLIFKL